MSTLIHAPKKYNYIYFLLGVFVLLALGSCKKSFEIVRSDENSDRLYTSASSKPNILLIIGDDIGYEVPTCDGGQSYSTPNLDKLARNGKLFTQCHSSPLCSPSRISLLTGKYNFRNYTKWGYLSTDQRTIGNMLSDAGYATCYAGKWQLDGGDNSIHTFGWQKYAVFLPYLLESERLGGYRYKNPTIFEDGAYLPDSVTKNQYGDDMFTNYIINFIDSADAINKPFLAYYAMNLCHAPFCPTPADPEYTTWDYVNYANDEKFFPSMVNYMDKKIGMIITHLYQKNLLNNTVIIYIGDNGTPPMITSMWNGISVPGGKAQTTEIGLSVPLICAWNNNIPKNKKCNSLIGFTDFLPTFADLAGIPEPSNYGTLDGVSFYPQLVSTDTNEQRETIFNSYCVTPAENPWKRWVQNDSFKLYDTNRLVKNYKFVQVSKCLPDSPPLTKLTPEQKELKNEFIQVLRSFDQH